MMKKLDIDNVGSIWTIILLVASVIIAIVTIGFIPILVAVAIATVILGMPHAITWVWNKFVTEEMDSDNEENQ